MIYSVKQKQCLYLLTSRKVSVLRQKVLRLIKQWMEGGIRLAEENLPDAGQGVQLRWQVGVHDISGGSYGKPHLAIWKKFMKKNWNQIYMVIFSIGKIINSETNDLLSNYIDRTMKKKLEKSSLVHVYFKSLGVTRFTKDTLFAWQDLVCECQHPIPSVDLCFYWHMHISCNFDLTFLIFIFKNIFSTFVFG